MLVERLKREAKKHANWTNRFYLEQTNREEKKTVNFQSTNKESMIRR